MSLTIELYVSYILTVQQLIIVHQLNQASVYFPWMASVYTKFQLVVWQWTQKVQVDDGGEAYLLILCEQSESVSSVTLEG